ncbi:MAG: nucleotide exchange factor GrpE [Reyranellaceae bacterium]
MPHDDKDLSGTGHHQGAGRQPGEEFDKRFEREFDPDGDDGSLDIPNRPQGSQGGDPAQKTQAGDRVAELEAQVGELRDQALRAMAEAENVRKRMQREMEDATKFAVTRFARDMLSVADNLGRALQAVPENRDGLDPAIKGVIEGIEATERELMAIFERNGIRKIEPVGEPFNPEYHQAVMEVPTSDHPPGTVALMMMPGYLLKERLLRPAMVGVAKAG